MTKYNKMSYFILYANCLPVKGANRSIICDLQRNQFWYIPNDLYDILIEFNKVSIAEIKKYYNNKQNDIIEEYFDFLLVNDLGFLGSSNDVDNFPSITLEWDEPSIITNSIVDSNINSRHNFENIFNQLEQLGCKYLQLRFFDEIELSIIDEILDNLKTHRIISVEIILPFVDNLTEDLNRLTQKHGRITQIVFFGAKSQELITKNYTKIIYVLDKIDSVLHCGVISQKFFSINIKNYTESINHNSCLNRKISIDSFGEIKNCPSMLKSYGNIKEITLTDVLLNDEFKAVWSINKDNIKACGNCEFRYICTDCRAYTENPKDIYSKPLKCGYDPTTCQWSEWSNNPLKENAIKYYGMAKLKM